MVFSSLPQSPEVIEQIPRTALPFRHASQSTRYFCRKIFTPFLHLRSMFECNR